MTKFKTLNKSKKITRKNLILLSCLLFTFMLGIIISKSYAVYKLEKKYDLIQSKIGSFTNGDIKIAVLVDGKETNEFPSYETNYKIESVECTNGVTGSFDVENWQVTIADMKATSTKCTVSFNSSATNEITPVNMSKTELIALNEEIKNTSAKQLANYLYPVGSIYMSTEDDTVEKVQNKFGGTWVRYATDTTLVGYKENTNKVNDTGGSKTVTLTTDNLPSHSHSFTPSGNVSSTFTGSSVSTSPTNTDHTHYLNAPTSSGGSHTHNLTGPAGHSYGITMNEGTTQSNSVNFTIVADRINQNNYYGRITVDEQGLHSHTISANTGGMSKNSSHSHTVTAKGSVSSSFTGTSGTTGSTGSSKEFSVQNPYTVVYMYKRTA